MTWQIKKIGDVCHMAPPKNEARKKLSNEDSVSFVPMEDLGILSKSFISNKERKLKDVSTNYTYFTNGDVLMAKITPCFENGKLGVAANLKNGVGFGSSEFIVFRPKEVLLPDFLFYFLSIDNFRMRGAKVMTGAVGHKRVPKDFIENYIIPLPSLAEQKNITKTLDEVFENIEKAKEAAKKNLENSKELFETYLQNIFTNRGKGWETQTLGDVSEIVNRGISPKYSDNGVVVLNQKCIRNHEINFSLARLHDHSLKKVSTEKYIQIGDVLVNSTGVGTLGRVAQVKELKNPATVDSHITIVRPKKNLFLNDFFGFAMIFIEKEIAKSGVGASGQIELARTTLKNDFSISFPKSILEQKKLAKNIEQLEAKSKKLAVIYQQKLAALEELKRSVLKNAFKERIETSLAAGVPSPYIRNQVHAAIIEQVARDGGWTTEVAVVKYDHLLQEIYKLKLEYQFQEGLFGPFDGKIKNIISSGLTARNRWFQKRHGMIVLGSNIDSLTTKKSNLYKSAQAAMQELAKIGVTKFTAEQIELLSTVFHSIKQKQSLSLNDVRDFMSRWPTDDGKRTKAEKFSEERTQKCIDFLIKYNLHQRAFTS